MTKIRYFAITFSRVSTKKLFTHSVWFTAKDAALCAAILNKRIKTDTTGRYADAIAAKVKPFIHVQR